jgi:hypothetical protein
MPPQLERSHLAKGRWKAGQSSSAWRSCLSAILRSRRKRSGPSLSLSMPQSRHLARLTFPRIPGPLGAIMRLTEALRQPIRLHPPSAGHAGAGRSRNWTMSDRISQNIWRGTATSAWPHDTLHFDERSDRYPVRGYQNASVAEVRRCRAAFLYSGQLFTPAR